MPATSRDLRLLPWRRPPVAQVRPAGPDHRSISFHGLASKSGSQTVANCASCHGVHGILPSSDPKSMINARNLPATCGKCHPGAGTRFALGRFTVEAGGTGPAALGANLHPSLIPATIGLMLHHAATDSQLISAPGALPVRA
jgi:hypothetical protein